MEQTLLMEQTLRTGRATRSAAMLVLTLILLAAIGCSPPADRRDERLAEFARHSAEQQARQNERTARWSQADVGDSKMSIGCWRTRPCSGVIGGDLKQCFIPKRAPSEIDCNGPFAIASARLATPKLTTFLRHNNMLPMA